MRKPLVALFVLLLATIAFGDTGGSMGGGSWGGGPSSSSSSTSSSSSSRSSSGGGGWSSSSSSSSSNRSRSNPTYPSSSSSGGSSYAGRGCTDDETAGFFIVVGVGAVLSLLVWGVLRVFARPVVEGQEQVDISVLRVAVDGRARKFVQAEMSRIALVSDTATDAGRVYMLGQVASLLRKLHDAWVYAGAVNHPKRPMLAAKNMFDSAVDDTRARFREEVIRNADGVIQTREASAYTPRADEGEGLFLVSIILAARRELYTVEDRGNGADVRRALESATRLPAGALVAVEIVWQPAVDGDRLSSMELEAKYPPPELQRVVGAVVGKTFCDHCSGPFPAELVSCPHCGAPSKGRDFAA